MQNNIGEARRSYGLTTESGKFSQEDAARHFGVSVSTYQKWEQGTGKSLKIETLCAIADLYGTSVDYLLCRTNSPTFDASRHLGRYERELLTLVGNMDETHRKTLMSTACAFSALSEKDGAVSERAGIPGTMDAVR